MDIELFEMERWQSVWENRVRYNLSESGVHPMRLSDLVNEDGLEQLQNQRLCYIQTNGTVKLRRKISSLYPGTGTANIVVTNGTAEANFISVLNLVSPGDEVVVMLPNYMQIWGLTRSLGANVRSFWLRSENGWAPDFEELESLVNEKTRLIAICNPNNPTGAVLSEDAMQRICDLAKEAGTWLLSDEVYQGAELDRQTTPTFWGRYDQLIVTSGLSKAYGLPGLRIGWAVCPEEKAKELWSCKDYTSIAPGALSDFLACIALEPDRQAQILERTRTILNQQLPMVERWVASNDDVLKMTPPKAGAFSVVQYDLEIGSTRLMEELRDEKSVLIVPGDQFMMDRCVRIGYGGAPEDITEGLGRFSELLTSYR